MSAEEKQEALRLVESSPVCVAQTLAKLSIPRRTYYRWQCGGTLKDDPPVARRVWNRLLDDEVVTVLVHAFEYPDLSARELAFKMTDEGSFSVSESTVSRILKRHGLMRQLSKIVPAAKEYHRKTTRVHELWQTDFTYFYIVDWGWYYAGGALDDFSRYSICYELMESMDANAVARLIAKAVERTGMMHVPLEQRVKLLSDSGSGFIARAFNEYLDEIGIHHIYAMRNHPQTNGKIERLNRTVKEKLTLVLYTSPAELQEALDGFYEWYNHQHYHEGIGNLHPADVYYGRSEVILEKRKRLQQQTKMTRKRANLKPTKNIRRKRTLRVKTLH